MTRIWFLVWQYGPTAGIRSWGWKLWLDAQWLQPPHAQPTQRDIDQPTQDTGYDDPHLKSLSR